MTLAVALAAAAVPGAAQSPANIVALSTACRVPDAEMAAIAPLSRVTELIRSKAKVIRILAIGSSSTVGLGATTSQKRYPDQIEDILETTVKGLDIEIINRGVSGELAQATAARLRHEVALIDPDLVLWQVGTNDALARVPVEEYEEILADTIAWVKGHGKDIVLVGLQYSKRTSRDPHCQAIRDANARAAAKAGILYVKRYSAMQFLSAASKANPSLLLSQDEFHLNDLGYRCMAEHVARALTLSIFGTPRRADVPAVRSTAEPLRQ